MKTFQRVSGGVAVLSLVFGLVGTFGLPAPVAHAATSPDLGTAADYSILAGSEVTNTGASTVSGDVGISPGIGAPPHYSGFGTVTLGGTIHDGDGDALTAQGDKDTAVSALAAQTCDTTYAGAFKELAGEVLPPGVYCADSFHLTNGTLTLDGDASDVWVLKSASDLIITGSASEVIFVGTGVPCNVWWNVVSTATFDAGSSFVGNILASTSITFAAGASLDGRALASTAEVTMDSTSITGPTCTAPSSSDGGTDLPAGTVTVVKTVINDNGGTMTIEDFPLFMNGMPVVSGETNIFSSAAAYDVTETTNASYTQSFSGDCDENGRLSLNAGETKVCVVTNDDIGAPVVVPPVPPLIDVVKVPSPLALPDGPDSVEYTYTTRNIGTVPMSDVTLVGDTCSPIVLVSGDTDDDEQLDVTETWTYTCSTTLTETHTNTVVATGWANGISSVDIASATVVVGTPVVPPLVHLTKVPSPLTLPVGGGLVTYTQTVTNPGTVALSNVSLTDDLCGPMTFVSGDSDDDSLLDPTETWTYTCQATVTTNTTNTASVSGAANGFIVQDFAVAPVVVATAAATVPTLPNAGVGPANNILSLIVMAVGAIATSFALYGIEQKRNT